MGSWGGAWCVVLCLCWFSQESGVSGCRSLLRETVSRLPPRIFRRGEFGVPGTCSSVRNGEAFVGGFGSITRNLGESPRRLLGFLVERLNATKGVRNRETVLRNGFARCLVGREVRSCMSGCMVYRRYGEPSAEVVERNEVFLLGYTTYKTATPLGSLWFAFFLVFC